MDQSAATRDPSALLAELRLERDSPTGQSGRSRVLPALLLAAAAAGAAAAVLLFQPVAPASQPAPPPAGAQAAPTPATAARERS